VLGVPAVEQDYDIDVFAAEYAGKCRAIGSMIRASMKAIHTWLAEVTSGADHAASK